MTEPLYRPSLFDRIFRSVVMVGLVVAFLFVGVIGYWLFWPFEGLTSYTATIKSPVVQGGLLTGTIRYCVGATVPLPIRIDRDVVLQNHVVSFPMSEIEYTITQRCEDKHRMMPIPSGTPPGTYRMIITTSVQVNPLRVVRQTWSTPTFEVVAK